MMSAINANNEDCPKVLPNLHLLALGAKQFFVVFLAQELFGL
jgi:hypothetical protein